MFGSLPTTLLSYARAAPSPRHVPTTPPARSRTTRSRPHAAQPVTHSGHVPSMARRLRFTPRARITLGGSCHGTHDPPHGHGVARIGCGHIPPFGPARTRSPRRPRSPWRPATRLMAARSPRHQHACLLLHAPALTRAEVRSSLLRHARPGPTRLTTRGPPPPLSPYTHARARSLCATRGFPIAGS